MKADEDKKTNRQKNHAWQTKSRLQHGIFHGFAIAEENMDGFSVFAFKNTKHGAFWNVPAQLRC